MKVKALVIDDSRVMRNMVMQTLQRTALADFSFIEGEDGKDALETISFDIPDIIFVDWNMPNMTGIDFVRKIRSDKRNASIPIIMVTSERAVGKIQEALDGAGANAFITKPFTADVLKRQLEHIFKEMEEKRATKGHGFFSKLLGT